MTHHSVLSRLLLLVATTALAVPSVLAESGPVPIGLAELTRLDHLPRFRPSASIGSVSSYDRTGGNDDGFSGKYSFIRQEGDGLVIAELTGPGVIYRIATPTPTDDPLEFYFDGEAAPRLRLPFRHLFDGSTPPFLTPLVDRGSGGNWSYVPLSYAKSCKIVLRGPKMQFYQINYATFPAGTALASFSPTAPEYTGPTLTAACGLLGRTGQDVSSWVVPAGAHLETTKTRQMLAPGRAITLFDAKHGGRIAGLRVGPAAALAGRDRSLVLRISWDDETRPAVLCPAGDFFGFSWGQPSARSLLVGSAGDTCYAYFPMPYDRSAKIELVSERTSGTAVEITAEVVHADLPRQMDEGRFYASWRRENPTTTGKPFTFVDVQGRGHLVGVTLQAEGEKTGFTGFFEGDDHATVDGALVINGTGSEDFFNGGWYDVPGQWETRASYPLNGCLDYLRPLSRSGAYRLFLTDAYAFHRSLNVDIEHAPEGNTDPADYTGVSYLYLEKPPAGGWSLPPVADRAVQEVSRLIYKPGWYQPSFTYSIERASVLKHTEKFGGTEYRFLSVRATEAEDFLGPHHLAFFCELPAAGRYRVSLATLQGPEQGAAQLFANSQPVGEARSGRAAQPAAGPLEAYGELDLREGVNRIFFRLSDAPGGSGKFAVDVESLVLERVR